MNFVKSSPPDGVSYSAFSAWNEKMKSTLSINDNFQITLQHLENKNKIINGVSQWQFSNHIETLELLVLAVTFIMSLVSFQINQSALCVWMGPAGNKYSGHKFRVLLGFLLIYNDCNLSEHSEHCGHSGQQVATGEYLNSCNGSELILSQLSFHNRECLTVTKCHWLTVKSCHNLRQYLVSGFSFTFFYVICVKLGNMIC